MMIIMIINNLLLVLQEKWHEIQPAVAAAARTSDFIVAGETRVVTLGSKCLNGACSTQTHTHTHTHTQSVPQPLTLIFPTNPLTPTKF